MKDRAPGRVTATDLADERTFANTLIDSVPAIVLLLSPEGIVQRINPYAEALLGYRLDEIRGKNWIATFLPRDQQEEIKALLARTAGGKSTRGHINQIVTRSGDIREIEWSDTTIRDGSGRTVSILAIGHDVTERVKTQKALCRYEQFTQEVERLSHIGIFDHDHLTDVIYWSPELRRIFGWAHGKAGHHSKIARPDSPAGSRSRCRRRPAGARSRGRRSVRRRIPGLVP